VRDEGFLDPARVRALWREHLTQKRDWTDRLWNVIMFQAWLATQSNETQLAQRDSEQLSEVF
jgi:asparagine synthase (glutamine-hydrolysing)